MHQWTTLHTRENGLINLFTILRFTKNHSPTWPTQCLMCCRRHKVSMWNWVWMITCSNKSCNRSHVDEEISANFICELTEFSKVDHPRISTCSSDNYFRLDFFCFR